MNRVYKLEIKEEIFSANLDNSIFIISTSDNNHIAIQLNDVIGYIYSLISEKEHELKEIAVLLSEKGFKYPEEEIIEMILFLEDLMNEYCQCYQIESTLNKSIYRDHVIKIECLDEIIDLPDELSAFALCSPPPCVT